MIVACVALFVVGFVFKKLREITPTLMVSAGIIGTFWGTFIALAQFETGGTDSGLDPEAMVNSIPMVLAGMKTAFITTLIGLLSAFASRLLIRIFAPVEEPPTTLEYKFQKVLEEIRDGIGGESDNSLSSKIGALQAEYRDSTNVLKQAISGESDSSIASQLTKLRNENSDALKQLNKHMDGLADTIRNSLVENMENLVKELREIIVNQLTEQLKQTNEILRTQLGEMLDRIEEALIKQFGETFKQFNEATQAIKKWQEDHRVQVEQLTEAFSETATAIEKVRADCESIPETMAQLKTLMGELDERLKAFADMKESAVQSFPVIKEHLDAIGVDLKQSAAAFSGLEETIRTTYQQAGNLAQQHIENVGTQINRTAEQLQSAADGMIKNSEGVVQQHLQGIQSANESMRQELTRYTSDIQTALKTTSEQISEQINQVGGEVEIAAEKMMVNSKEVLDQHSETSKEMLQSVKDGTENMLSEISTIASQHQKNMQDVVNVTQKEHTQLINHLQATLEEMTKKSTTEITNSITKIMKEWGDQAIGIAEKMQEVINKERH